MLCIVILLAGAAAAAQITPPNPAGEARYGLFYLPTSKTIGRITITTDTWNGFRIMDEFNARQHDAFFAQVTGSGWVQQEADERLALVLEAFQWKDLEFFNLVLSSYGVTLTPRK